MPGSITGSWGVTFGIAEMLKAKLPASIAEVLASAQGLGYLGGLEMPSSEDGFRVSFSYSPTWIPRDRFNGIQVFCDSTDHVSNYMNINSVRTEAVVVGILWMISDKDPNLLEQKKQLGTTAVKRCIEEWWRATMSEHAIYDVRFTPTDFRFASMRMQGGSRRGLIGHLTETGDNIDAVVVGLRCLQQVDAPIRTS